MLEKKILTSSRITLFIICGLIILIAVFLVGLYWGQLINRDTYQQGYNDAWNQAKQLVDESGYFLPEPDEVFELAGAIIEINEINRTFTLDAQPISDNPLAKAGLLTRTVAVDENTLIFKNTPKGFEEFEAEQEEFDNLIAELGPEDEMPEAPAAYIVDVVKFNDLASGDMVIVASLADIKDVEQFTASQIDIYVPIEEMIPEEPAEPEELPGEEPATVEESLEE